MKSKSFKIIVLDDFSDNVESVFHFTTYFNKSVSLKVILLHIVDRENIAKMEKMSVSLETNIQTLQQRSEIFSKKFNVPIVPKIEQGNIFDTSPEVATHEKADFIAFCTTGITSLQKLIRSNAFRLIEKSSIPIAILQANYPQPLEKMITNSETDVDDFINLFQLPLQTVEKFSHLTNYNKALLLYKIPNATPIQKEEQKLIEQVIFNEQKLPVIFWKSNI